MINEATKHQEIIRRELFNVEAEQAILGTIIMNNEYINRVSDFLLAEHFYEPANKKIFEQITNTINKTNIIANQVTLKHFLKMIIQSKQSVEFLIFQHYFPEQLELLTSPITQN